MCRTLGRSANPLRSGLPLKIEHLLRGAATYLPGAQARLHRRTGGTDSATYCYGVWLRHLVMAHKNKLCPTPPERIAELGPGDSIGTGLAALISGSDTYYGLDVVRYANAERNLAIFDELVDLFRRRMSIPDGPEMARVKPQLGSYEFPTHVLPDARLDECCLKRSRLERIRRAIAAPNAPGSPIFYATQWFSSDMVRHETVDLIFSQSVLQYVEDVSATYSMMAAWLKPGGFMSHQIDYKSHKLSDEWNGHWRYSDIEWAVIKGRRTYTNNRAPHSDHIAALRAAGFTIAYEQRVTQPSALEPRELAPRFRHLSADDLTSSGAFIQSTKPMPQSAIASD